MDSFATIDWLRDLYRADTGTPAGRGIFAKVNIPAETVVGLYWGHLVDSKGLVMVSRMYCCCRYFITAPSDSL